MKSIYSTIILALVCQSLLNSQRSSLAAERVIEGAIVDTDKRPIPSVKIVIYDDNNPSQDPIHLTTDAAGAFQATLPFRDFAFFVRSPDSYEEIGGLRFSRSRSDIKSPHVDSSVNGDNVKLIVTLQRPFNILFQLDDARSRRPVTNAALFFKEDQESWENSLEGEPGSTSPWSLYQVLKEGKIEFRERTSKIMENADILVLATGYQPLRVKLNEKLVRGKTLEKRLELVPLPKLGVTIITPEGQPAVGAVFDPISPDETLDDEEYSELFRFKDRIKGVLDIAATTNAQGTVQFEYPAFGERLSYRLRHPTGYAEFNVRNLKTSRDSIIQHRIELNRYATIRGKYLPKIGPNENLELYRILGDRMTRVDPAIPVSVDQNGNFDIRQLLAGWYVLAHRIHYGGRDGRANSVVLVAFDRIRIVEGQVVELVLGMDGRSARGRLILPADYRFEDHQFEISMDPDIECPDYPRPSPGIMNERELIAWWDAYWNSEVGRRFADCRVRNVHTVVSNDGTLYFPFVRPGTYRITRVLSTGNLNSPLSLPETKFTIPDDGNRQPFELGEIRILKK